MELTHKVVRDIVGMIDDAQHLEEMELVFGGFRLHVRRSAGGGDLSARGPAVSHPPPTHAPPAQPQAGQPETRQPQAAWQAPTAAPTASAASSGDIGLAEHEVAVLAPMIGTFYHAASPGDKPFVVAGQRVKADDTIGVIEVMKLFNTIRAGVEGTVVRIEADNATLVEYNQRLVVIRKG